MREIEALGAVVCGVSVDSGARLAEFSARHRLSFALLSDRDGTVAGRYGSIVNLGLLKLARRNSFLIDPQARVAKVYLNARPEHNAAEVIGDLKEEENRA